MALIEGLFAAQEGNSGVAQNSRELLQNMYAEIEVSGRSKLVRRQRPGLTRVYAVAGVKRGIEEFTHGHYLVIRDGAYKFDGTTLTLLGSLGTNIGPVTIITDDNEDVLFSDGETAYHYDSATAAWSTPTTPTDVGTLAFQGGFGIYAEPGADQFYISALNNLTSWDALDFATAEGAPDRIVRVFVDHNEVLFFGASTVEVWRNTGAQDFPFAPNTQLERGCLAAFSVASDDNSVFWLGDDKIVYRMDGYRPVRVSTHAIEEWIADAPEPEDARAFIYTVRGHKFYTLTFPGYGTRQFNIATGFWNSCQTWERDEWVLLGGAGKSTSYYLTDAGIVTLDNTVNTDEGEIIERGGISAPVFNAGELMTLSTVWLDVEVGRVAEGVTEPQIMLQMSRNGEEFGSVRTRGLGETGDYRRRVVWRGLGQAREFQAKITCTDNVELNIMSIFGDIQ